MIEGVITTTGGQVYGIGHQCSVTSTPHGFGRSADFSVVETYAWLSITRMA